MPKSSAIQLAEILPAVANVDVAGCMSAWKKPSRSACREEHLHRRGRQLLDVDASSRSRASCLDRDAVHALHTNDVAAAVVPVLSGTRSCASRRSCAQLRPHWPLAHGVELVVQVLAELGDHFARAQPLAVAATASPPAAHRSRAAPGPLSIAASMPGRSTLTANLAPASLPSFSTAKCTCAIEALATGSRFETGKDLVGRRPKPALDLRTRVRNRKVARGPAAPPVRRRPSVGSRSRRVEEAPGRT